MGSINDRLRILVVYGRTSGPDATRHSLLEVGAAWLVAGEDQEPEAAEFGRFCSLRAGAEWDQKTAELTGLVNPAEFAESPYLDTPAELVSELLSWAGISEERPVILAGSRPGMIRKFLVSSVASRFSPNLRVRGFHRQLLDFHSAFVLYSLARGLVIPADGFPVHRVFEELEISSSSPRIPALESAKREREALRKMIRDLSPPVPHAKN